MGTPLNQNRSPNPRPVEGARSGAMPMPIEERTIATARRFMEESKNESAPLSFKEALTLAVKMYAHKPIW